MDHVERATTPIPQTMGSVEPLASVSDHSSRDARPSRALNDFGASAEAALNTRQRLTHQVLHGDEIRTLNMTKIEYGTDIRVVQLRGQPRFVEEELDERRIVGEVRVDSLQRD